MKVDIAWLQRHLGHGLTGEESGKIRGRLTEMTGVTDAAISSVQRIATELRPVVLDTLGLCAAMEWQANDFETRTGIKCELSLPPEDVSIGREESTALFRILQESLTNVIRYADATKVEIDLEYEPNLVTLRVRDNGKGIQLERINDPHSLGLVGMRERATLLGGECQIMAGQSKGTVVEARLPSGVKVTTGRETA